MFKYPEELYNLSVLKSNILSDKEMRKEYAHLRSVALKRVKRMEKSKFSDSDFLERYRNTFSKPASQIPENDLSYGLSDLYKFLSSDLSTIRGQKRYETKRIKGLRESGYDFIDERNLKDFGKFMEDWRLSNESMVYGSETAATLYDEFTRLKIDPNVIKKDWQEYVNKIYEISKMKRPLQGEGVNSNELLERIKNL